MCTLTVGFQWWCPLAMRMPKARLLMVVLPLPSQAKLVSKGTWLLGCPGFLCKHPQMQLVLRHGGRGAGHNL